jgi:hypothetical protein
VLVAVLREVNGIVLLKAAHLIPKLRVRGFSIESRISVVRDDAKQRFHVVVSEECE